MNLQHPSNHGSHGKNPHLTNHESQPESGEQQTRTLLDPETTEQHMPEPCQIHHR